MDPSSAVYYAVLARAAEFLGAARIRRDTPAPEAALAAVATADFDAAKQKTLEGLLSPDDDKSRAGGVDPQIADVVDAVNFHPHLFTTSSCAGRVIATESGPKTAYGDVGWLFVSHELPDPEVVSAVLVSHKPSPGSEVWLRMESPIVQICARDLDVGQHILNMARACGFKKPTLTGVRGKVIVSIVDTKRVEVPVWIGGKLVVSKEYVELVVRQCNEKLAASRRRMDGLRSAMLREAWVPTAPEMMSYPPSIVRYTLRL
eukprot:m51a1_g9768 hypothetical protein (260) ;mRNA; f:1651954-1653061